ncbi:GDSL-type esterase/lipase family protein [uncultured Gemmiger sp.]|uniref:GDSL-type esterase/lipase family protein n=1 Tax=uncultured Gemmiger sp. TaxID=1623490 RepID=UPI0025F460D0|nr:GDSL-type esterase/lipase family protein [uncultured Gemmiger sp.]
MPNREGGYGGYRSAPEQKRQVHAPGTGGVRRMRSPGSDLPPAATQGPRRPPAASRQAGPSRQASGAAEPRRRRAAGEPPRSGRYQPPVPPQSQFEADGWIKPPAPPQQRKPRPQADPAGEALRALARRARQDRRLRRRLTLIGTFAGILLVSALITAVLPDNAGGSTAETAQAPTAGMTASLVAPLPYMDAGSQAETIDWGDVGPARQSGTFTLTATPEQSVSVPAFGLVDLSWFDDAAFLGDSLTVGFRDYAINIGDALVCAYEGISPNQIANRTTMSDGTIPLDALAADQPKKLYVLMGANALAYRTDNDEGFLSYYGMMLDELKAALPNTTIFVQSILPVRADAVTDLPGLTPERVASINTSLQRMAAEKGCYYLALNEALTDESGYLNASYAEQDGLHLTVSGYNIWVEYLRTHVPYDKDNPYQIGSTYYLDDEMKALLADLP